MEAYTEAKENYKRESRQTTRNPFFQHSLIPLHSLAQVSHEDVLLVGKI